MIKVEHITKSFGNLHALDDVSIEIKKGEIIKKVKETDIVSKLLKMLDE